MGTRDGEGGKNAKTDAFLSVLLYFICDSICLSERKSISDDNPACQNERLGVPESWESCLWRRTLISAE